MDCNECIPNKCATTQTAMCIKIIVLFCDKCCWFHFWFAWNEENSAMSESKETASTSAESVDGENKKPEIDPELDIRSEHFNPLRALYAPEIFIPVKNPPLYNNLAHFESAMKRRETDSSLVSKRLSHSKKIHWNNIKVHFCFHWISTNFKWFGCNYFACLFS